MHKYLFKVFYRKINKKEYKLQILEYNKYHINLIALQNIILIVKVLVKSAKKKKLIVDMPNAEIMQVYNTTNILLKYNWHLDPTDNKVTINLRLQSIKKY